MNRNRAVLFAALGIAALVFVSTFWRSRTSLPQEQSGSLRQEPPSLDQIDAPAELIQQWKEMRISPASYSAESGFEYPFVGRVVAKRSEEQVAIPGGAVQKVRVYRTADGELIRAEYAKNGTYLWDFPPESMITGYQMAGHRHRIIKPGLQKLSLAQVIERLNAEIPLTGARQWAVTAIELEEQLSLEGSVPTYENFYEAMVFGVWTAGGNVPDTEIFKRLRILMRLDGTVRLSDNQL